MEIYLLAEVGNCTILFKGLKGFGGKKADTLYLSDTFWGD
jgi:hypothetical protein